MALIDSRNIFCDKQVIADTTLSQRSLDLTGLSDHAVGINLYVHCLTQGDFSNDLRVQILGAEDNTFANPIVIGDSGVIQQANLVNGSDFFVQMLPVGEKYRFVCLRIIPTVNGVGSETVSGSDTPNVSAIAVVTPVGSEDTPIANALRAQIETVAALGKPVYSYANADKATA